jgi:hypothetical protein
MSLQQSSYGLLNLFGRQRDLTGFIIEIGHLALGSQSLQYPAKFWCAVFILCSAKCHNPPMKLRMGEYIATAPKYLVIRVSDDNRSAHWRTGYHVIELERIHYSPRRV